MFSIWVHKTLGHTSHCRQRSGFRWPSRTCLGLVNLSEATSCLTWVDSFWMQPGNQFNLASRIFSSSSGCCSIHSITWPHATSGNVDLPPSHPWFRSAWNGTAKWRLDPCPPRLSRASNTNKDCNRPVHTIGFPSSFLLLYHQGCFSRMRTAAEGVKQFKVPGCSSPEFCTFSTTSFVPECHQTKARKRDDRRLSTKYILIPDYLPSINPQSKTGGASFSQ